MNYNNNRQKSSRPNIYHFNPENKNNPIYENDNDNDNDNFNNFNNKISKENQIKFGNINSSYNDNDYNKNYQYKSIEDSVSNFEKKI